MLLTSCSNASPRSRNPADALPEPQLGKVPKITDWRQVVIPLDAYELGIRDTVLVDRAEHRLVGKCMQRFGLVFDVPFNERDVSGLQITHYRLYGLLDEKSAATYGYHPGPSAQKGGKGSEDSPTSKGGTISRDFANVLGAKYGGGTFAGQQIPEGGCYGEAHRRVADGGKVFDPLLPEKLAGESFDRAENDSRVIAAYTRWSACMAAAGFHYRTSRDANNDDRWAGSTISSAEIAVATNDVRCKKETNLVGWRMAVDSAYQRILIERNAEALDAVRKGHERQLRNAALILAAS